MKKATLKIMENVTDSVLTKLLKELGKIEGFEFSVSSFTIVKKDRI
jgi:HKD family nuclease